MKWLSISSESRQRIYELRENQEKLLDLTYHPASGTIRISTNDEKRVFLIGREGFIRSRVVLRNEYGIRMGQLSHEGGQDNQGNIEISGEQFNYTLENKSNKSALYKNGEILVVFDLPEASRSFSNGADNDLLILTLCWYFFVAVKMQEEEYV